MHAANCVEHCLGVLATCVVSYMCQFNTVLKTELWQQESRTQPASATCSYQHSLPQASLNMHADRIQHSSHCSMSPTGRCSFSNRSGFHALHPLSYIGLENTSAIYMSVCATGARQPVVANWQHLVRKPCLRDDVAWWGDKC